jgi:hypothetical protein
MHRNQLLRCMIFALGGRPIFRTTLWGQNAEKLGGWVLYEQDQYPMVRVPHGQSDPI